MESMRREGIGRRGLALGVLALALVLAPSGAQEQPFVPLRGRLLLDGRTWPGGRARLVPVDDRSWEAPRGAAVEVAADERGDFAVNLTRGPWRVHDAGSWPAGASLRCELRETPHAPGRGLVWIGYATTCRALIHGEDDVLELDVLSPVVVTGRVVDPSGAPASRARVSVERAGRLDPGEVVAPVVECDVGPDGAFSLPVPAWLADHLRASLVARAPGRGLAAASLGLLVDHEDGDVRASAPVTLTLATAPLDCEGRILDLDGQPLACARVWGELRVVDARDPDELAAVPVEVQCDTDGRFGFEGVGGSGWSPRGPAYAVVELNVDTPGFDGGDDVVFGPGVESVLRARRTDLALGGVVLDAAGAPLAGATVIVDRAEQRTGPDGRFEARASELCDLVIRAPGHAPTAQRARLPLSDLSVQLAPAASPLGGRVVDSAGRPLGGREVRVGVHERSQVAPDSVPAVGTVLERSLSSVDPLATAITSADGRFELNDLPPDVDLWIDTDDLPARLTRAGELVTLSLAPVTRVTAAAARAEDGAPLTVNWSVWITSGRRSTSRTYQGTRLAHEEVWAGEVSVTASAPGRVSVRRDGLRATGEALDLGELRLPLRGPGSLRLRVRWPEVPLRQLSVEWTNPSGAQRGDTCGPARFDPSEWVLDGLTPGQQVLRFRAFGLDGERELGALVLHVDVRANGESQAELDLRELR